MLLFRLIGLWMCVTGIVFLGRSFSVFEYVAMGRGVLSGEYVAAMLATLTVALGGLGAYAGLRLLWVPDGPRSHAVLYCIFLMIAVAAARLTVGRPGWLALLLPLMSLGKLLEGAYDGNGGADSDV